jgi:hypothetical protein
LQFSPGSLKASLEETFMKRRWNSSLWMGFLFVVAGLLSYVPLFSLFPITRDLPWANLLLFVAGGVLLAMGLVRAVRQPQLYRGKFFGPVLALLSVAGVGFFVYGLLYMGRQLPASAAAPRVGQKAPDITLPDQNGKRMTLADLLASPPAGTASARTHAVLLIFYRGYW